MPCHWHFVSRVAPVQEPAGQVNLVSELQGADGPDLVLPLAGQHLGVDARDVEAGLHAGIKYTDEVTRSLAKVLKLLCLPSCRLRGGPLPGGGQRRTRTRCRSRRVPSDEGMEARSKNAVDD